MLKICAAIYIMRNQNQIPVRAKGICLNSTQYKNCNKITKLDNTKQNAKQTINTNENIRE